MGVRGEGGGYLTEGRRMRGAGRVRHGDGEGKGHLTERVGVYALPAVCAVMPDTGISAWRRSWWIGGCPAESSLIMHGRAGRLR